MQAAVTQRFGIEPPHLATESALYDIPGFRDQALQLPSRNGLFLKALF
jgi:hypothetical protein